MQVPSYPAALSATAWNSHKSIIAKVLPGKNTGIGEALVECKKGYDAMVKAVADLDPNVVTMADDARIREYSDVRMEALDYKQKLEAVETKARTAAKSWESKICPVPKATRVYAEGIASSAKGQIAALKAATAAAFA